nr:MAG TPA: hypothetical protein [Caudoviricetes sp.]
MMKLITLEMICRTLMLDSNEKIVYYNRLL